MLSSIVYLEFILVALLFVFFKDFTRAKLDLCLKVKKVMLYAFAVFALSSVLSPDLSYADDGLFKELTDKGSEIFEGMRDIVYVVAGFGIIGVAVGGFFGNLNWKWLSAIIIGLIVIAVTAAFINYVTGVNPGKITDTLK